MEYRFKEYHEKPVKRGHLNMGGENPAHERIDVTSKYFERNGRTRRAYGIFAPALFLMEKEACQNGCRRE